MENIYGIYIYIYIYIVWLIKKCPTGEDAISPQPIEIFYPKFQDLQGKDFSTIPENFTDKFSLLQKLQLFKCSIPYFQSYAEK